MKLVKRSLLELTFLILFTTTGECFVDTTNLFAGLNITTCLFSGCPDLCQLSTNDEILFGSSWRCKCDKLCTLFGDCCWNYFKSCELLTTADEVVTFIRSIGGKLPPRRVKAAVKLRKYGRCTHVKNRMGYFSKGFYAVSRCPEDYQDDSIRSRCENSVLAIPLNIPVANRWNLKEIYSNLFCAMCHDLEARNTIFWDASIFCSFHSGRIDLNGIRKKYAESHCFTFVNEKTRFHIRSCKVLYPDRCTSITNTTHSQSDISLSYSEIKSVCDSYISPVLLNDIKIANPHCSFCSVNSSEYKLINCLTSTMYDIPDWLLNATRYIIRVSLLNTTLALLSPHSKVDISDMRCADNERYNYLVERCDVISCSVPSMILLPNGLCGFVLSAGLLLQTKSQLWVTIELDTVVYNKNNYKILTDIIFTELNKVVDEYSNRQMSASVSIISQEKERRIERVSGISEWGIIWKYFIEIKINTSVSFSDALSLLDVFYGNFAYTENDFISYTVRKMIAVNYKNQDFNCINGTTAVLKNISIFNTNGMVFTRDELTDSYIDLEYVPVSFVWSENRSSMEALSIILCEHISPTCETFKLQYDEFKQTTDGKLHIFSQKHELVIESGQYWLAGDTAYICTQSFLKQWKQRDPVAISIPVHRLYHIIACSICVVCFCLLIVILLAFKQHGTRYLNLILVLTCMLMLAYGLELCIMLDTSSARAVISGILHFTWLQSFFILGLITIDLKQGYTKNANETGSGRSFVSAVVISLVVSLVILVCCIILNHDLTTSIQTGYGQGHTIWWIANPRPVLIFVIVPITFSVVFNMVTLVVVMYKRHTDHTKQPCPQRLGNEFQAFMLSNIILSLPWVIGVTADIYNDDNLAVVFYTLTAFVGVFFLWSYGLQSMFVFKERQQNSRDYHLHCIPSSFASASNQKSVPAECFAESQTGCSSDVDSLPEM